jgi:hypothetical protein
MSILTEESIKCYCCHLFPGCLNTAWDIEGLTLNLLIALEIGRRNHYDDEIGDALAMPWEHQSLHWVSLTLSELKSSTKTLSSS